jgi:putative hemolysin
MLDRTTETRHSAAWLGLAAGVLLALLAVPAAVAAQAEPSDPPAEATDAAASAGAPAEADLSDAREYCTSSGGTVQTRRATWNTNADPSDWVDLGRSIELCRFQADDEAQSRIYVDLLTLWSEQPSLAAGAYLARVPMDVDVAQGNPATTYCHELGGSAQFGSGAQGGGWVATDDPIDQVVAMCVFPDGSMIDEWGIAYMSDGTVRGADLSSLFRSAGQTYPPFFG